VTSAAFFLGFTLEQLLFSPFYSDYVSPRTRCFNLFSNLSSLFFDEVHDLSFNLEEDINPLKIGFLIGVFSFP